MKKILLSTLLIIGLQSTQIAQNCSELFISKYAHLGANNKCIEIYNPTANTVTLTNKYYVARYKTPSTSGNTSGVVPSPPNYSDTVYLKGTIAGYSTFVLCNPEITPSTANFNAVCNPSLAAKANQKGNVYGTYGSTVGDPTYFKGSDAITLEKKVGTGVTIIDIFGRFGDYMASSTGKPSAWSSIAPYTGGTGMGIWVTKDHLMIRKSVIQTGVSTNPAAFNPLMEWDTIPKPYTTTDSLNTFNKFGSHLCSCAPTNIKKNSSDLKINAFPNPIGDEQSLTLESTSQINAVEIYNIEGKLISVKSTTIKNNSAEIKLNIIPLGIYIAKVYHLNGSIGIIRFAKN